MTDWYDAPPYMTGFATPLGHDADPDPVQALHEVIADVTGKPVEAPKKPPMGFLPVAARKGGGNG